MSLPLEIGQTKDSSNESSTPKGPFKFYSPSKNKDS